MKIIYCTYDMSVSGGIERIVSTKANYLASKGYEVIILTMRNSNKASFFHLDPCVKREHIEIKYERQSYHKPIWKRFFFSLSDMWSYRKQMKVFVKKYKPDIIITTHLLPTFLLPTINDQSIKIQELHSSFYQYRNAHRFNKSWLIKLLQRFYELRDKFFISFFDKSVCLTKKDWILRGEKKSIQAIYNPSHLISESLAPLNNKKVLALSRFSEEKNLSSLINIWKVVVANDSSWNLTIAGGGYLKQQLMKQIKDLGLENSISLLDEQKDVEALYLSHSIVVLTSHFEGLPTVLLEAQYFGIPTISYDCPCGPSDIITDGEDGFLIDHDDEGTFAQRLLELMQNEDLRKKMGKKAKENSKRFNVNTIMSQWEELFTNLLEK